MPAPPSKTDNAKSLRLIATAILAGLFVVFLATFLPDDPSYGILLVRAMAEAGMIGGLADWFAIEALFRRPLGLPIPHTALLPTNQKRAATNIARFIDEHFLNSEELRKKVQTVKPLATGLDWLRKPGNPDLIAQEVDWLVKLVLQAKPLETAPKPVKKLVGKALRNASRSGHLSDKIFVLLQDILSSDVLDKVLVTVRHTIEDNRQTIVDLVQERSRWWIASGVDKRVAKVLIEAVVSILSELSEPNSDKRAQFLNSANGVLHRLKEEGLIAKYLDESLGDLETSKRFEAIIDDLFGALQRELQNTADVSPETFHDMAVAALRSGVAYLETHPAQRDMIEARIEDALIGLLDLTREHIRGYIIETISNWDSKELTERIESQVGRDLQFIRVNGSVLGAFLGGALFVLSHGFLE